MQVHVRQYWDAVLGGDHWRRYPIRTPAAVPHGGGQHRRRHDAVRQRHCRPKEEVLCHKLFPRLQEIQLHGKEFLNSLSNTAMPIVFLTN